MSDGLTSFVNSVNMLTAKKVVPLIDTSYQPILSYRKSPSNEWCNKFNNLWKRSDWLFTFLRSTDDYYRQPIKLRLPLIFYLGHLPCFAWYQFRFLPNVSQTIDVVFDELFQRGVDPDVQTGETSHQHSSRHSTDDTVEYEYWKTFTVQAVNEYKLKVRVEITRVLMNGHIDFSDINVLNILNVAYEHELLHQETLLYLFAQLPKEALEISMINQSKVSAQSVRLPLSENHWVSMDSGHTTLGKQYNSSVDSYSYGWDNEFPTDVSYLSDFEIQSHPVRIGDYLDFVLDGGYSNRQWWNDQVFEWFNKSNISLPASWIFDGESYRINFLLQRDIPIEYVLDHPVLVSQDEARAYCRWLSDKTGTFIELPTEAEWIYAVWDSSICMTEALINENCNVSFRYLHTLPIPAATENKLQWNGSAFEWTSSLFRPFSGYQGDLPSYPGYSSDFFDDKHYVLLGGSFATDLALIRRTFRNWYQHDYRYAFTTFRCVRRTGHTDDPLQETDRQTIIQSLTSGPYRSISCHYLYDAHGSAIYERITQLEEYYLYNQELKLLENQAVEIYRTVLENSPRNGTLRLIELGCGDGSKTEKLLLPWIRSKENISFIYHPVDISQHAIDVLVNRLKRTFGEKLIEQFVQPICSTFEETYSKLSIEPHDTKIVALLGSTIGNFSLIDENQVKFGENSHMMKFMRSIRSTLRNGDWFFCGMDLCKNLKTMIDAYSDSKGVTAAFNYNLLRRLNRELNFDFELKNFQHHALYNPVLHRMESWLISTKKQTVTDNKGFSMVLKPYEPILTEVSIKFTEEDISQLMTLNCLKIVKCFHVDYHHLPYCFCVAQAV